ncbi:hypothetical protein pb186bvf_005476 [Paramecium bursaria]
MVPPKVRDILLQSRIFYFTFSGLGIVAIMFLESDSSWWTTLRLIIELIVASLLYIKSSESPGSVVLDEIELQSHSASQGSLEQLQQQIPEKNYCEECRIYQTFRTKHCKQCMRCIPKYDHHCFWIGTCVGELNHRQFWAFLGSQCIFCLDGFFIFINQLDHYHEVDEDSEVERYSILFWYSFGMCCMSFGFMIFTGVLFFYHSMLIMTGQTTWEKTKRDKITYLNFYPKFYHPYNYGIIQNLKLTFLHQGKLSNWDPPPLDQIQRQINIFDNEYYSCC